LHEQDVAEREIRNMGGEGEQKEVKEGKGGK